MRVRAAERGTLATARPATLAVRAAREDEQQPWLKAPQRLPIPLNSYSSGGSEPFQIAPPLVPGCAQKGGCDERGSRIDSSLYNLAIARKLSLCFALLAAGLVVVAFVGSNGMDSMSAAHSDVVKVGVPKQLAAEEARAAAADMHFSQTR